MCLPGEVHGVELTDISLVMIPSPIMRTLIKEACLEFWVRLGCKRKLDEAALRPSFCCCSLKFSFISTLSQGS